MGIVDELGDVGSAKTVEIVGAVDLPAHKSKYVFAWNEVMQERCDELKHLNPVDLRERLRKISFDELTSSGAPKCYGAIRDKVLAINIALNLQGVIAPAHRQMRRPPRITKKAVYSKDEETLSNDRQVIDLHWIWVHKLPVSPVVGYTHLFEDANFNWDLAAQFARMAGRVSRKTKLLSLTEFHELQLCVLKSQNTVNRLQTIKKRIDKTMVDIKTGLCKPNSRAKPDVISQSDNLYLAMLLARGNPQNSVLAFRHITGITFGVNRMRRLIETFDVLAGLRGHERMAT